MSIKLYTIVLIVLLAFAGCRPTDPAEPDFSGIQHLTYTVHQTASPAAGPAHAIVYPNPFVNHLSVSLNSEAVIYVSDEKGKYTKKIEVDAAGGSQVTIDFRNMPQGIYLCEVHQAGQAKLFRLIHAK